LKKPPEIGIYMLRIDFVETSIPEPLLQQRQRLAKQIRNPINFNNILVHDSSKAHSTTVLTNPDFQTAKKAFGIII